MSKSIYTDKQLDFIVHAFNMFYKHDMLNEKLIPAYWNKDKNITIKAFYKLSLIASYDSTAKKLTKNDINTRPVKPNVLQYRKEQLNRIREFYIKNFLQ